MFCPDCGAKNQEGNKFCTGCGKSLHSAGTVESTGADTLSPRRPVKAQRSSKTWLWLAGGAVGLLCVVLVAVLAISWLPSVISSAEPERLPAEQQQLSAELEDSSTQRGDSSTDPEDSSAEPGDSSGETGRSSVNQEDPSNELENSDPSAMPSDEAMDQAIRESLKAPPGWTCREEDGGYLCTLTGDGDGYAAGIGVVDAEIYGVETTGPVTKSSIVAETPEEYRSEMEEIEVGGLSAFRACGEDGFGGVECNVIAGYNDRPLVIKYGATEEKFDQYEETFEAMLDGLRFQ